MATDKPTLKGYDSDDPKKARIKKAIMTRMRNKEETLAAELLERGWTVISPYDGSIRGPHKVKIEDTDS